MKKLFNDLMEKKAQEALKKENEQIMRKARLSELEEKNKSMRHKLLHPIKSANDGKEIKKLKGDIAAFEKDKEAGTNLLIVGGYFAKKRYEDVELVDFSRWVNCNTREDYREILTHWEENR